MSNANRDDTIADARMHGAMENTMAAEPVAGYLKYLDGLRGVAVLLVVLDHIFYSTLAYWPYIGWRATLRDALYWACNGRASLAFFIVLSGYLLMRPVLESSDGKLAGGIGGYLRRRAGRLLPAYYAALAGSLLLIYLLPPLRTPLNVEWRAAIPIGGKMTLISHLLLVQNFSYRWAYKIDPPIWTIATQWQIYLLFPALLLPIWRRIGMTGTVIVGLILGLGVFLATGKGHATASWFLSLFTFGMAAAARERPQQCHGYERAFYGWLALILFASYAAVTLAFSFDFYRFITPNGWGEVTIHWFFDIWIGAASACLLIHASAGGADSRVFRVFQSQSLVRVGVISYSLYLIHDPILAVMKISLDRAGLGPYQQFAGYLLVGVPILLLISWLFQLAFERPFSSSLTIVRGQSPA